MLFTCPPPLLAAAAVACGRWTCGRGLSLHVSSTRRCRAAPLFAQVLFIMLARMWPATGNELPAPQARKSQLDSFRFQLAQNQKIK